MFKGAIGIVETIGQVGSVEAADAMTKCAEVKLLGREDVGGSYFAVCVRGDVGSVRAALEAGVRAAERVGQIVNALLIPRPHDELEKVLTGFTSLTNPPLPTAAQLAEMNVGQLRSLARRMSGVGLRGREISRATREQLLAKISDLLHSKPDKSESAES